MSNLVFFNIELFLHPDAAISFISDRLKLTLNIYDCLKSPPLTNKSVGCSVFIRINARVFLRAIVLVFLLPYYEKGRIVCVDVTFA